jgi:protein MpaA
MPRLTAATTAVAIFLGGCLAPSPDAASRPASAPSADVEAATTRPAASAVRVQTIGTSVEGREIVAYFFGSGPYDTLIFAGIHGNETIAADVGRRLVDHLIADPTQLAGRSVIVIPHLSPDGIAARTRHNARGVDLNRNFPASNWRITRATRNPGGPQPLSEPETRALVGVLESHPLRKIVSLHAMHRGACNNFDGPGEPLAAEMARHNGYPVLASIGYPTPGSFGSYAGIDRQIAVVTLELPSRATPDVEWPKNRDALLAAIRFETTESAPVRAASR